MIFVIKMMTRWWWWWWSQIDWAGAGCLQRADKLELWPLTSSPPETFGCQKVGRYQCFQWLDFPCLKMSEYKRYWTRRQEQCGQNFIQTSNLQKKSLKDFAWLFKLKRNIPGGEKFLACQFSLQYYITVPWVLICRPFKPLSQFSPSKH